MTGWIGGWLGVGSLTPGGRLRTVALRTARSVTGSGLATRSDGVLMLVGTSADGIDESRDTSVVAAARLFG